jgi:hypothetical protein
MFSPLPEDRLPRLTLLSGMTSSCAKIQEEDAFQSTGRCDR